MLIIIFQLIYISAIVFKTIEKINSNSSVNFLKSWAPISLKANNSKTRFLFHSTRSFHLTSIFLTLPWYRRYLMPLSSLSQSQIKQNKITKCRYLIISFKELIKNNLEKNSIKYMNGRMLMYMVFVNIFRQSIKIGLFQNHNFTLFYRELFEPILV